MNTEQLMHHWESEAHRFAETGPEIEARHARACHRQLMRDRIRELESTDDAGDERMAAHLREHLAYLIDEEH